MNKAHGNILRKFGENLPRMMHELVRASCNVAIQYAKEERIHMYEANKRKKYREPKE